VEPQHFYAAQVPGKNFVADLALLSGSYPFKKQVKNFKHQNLTNKLMVFCYPDLASLNLTFLNFAPLKKIIPRMKHPQYVASLAIFPVFVGQTIPPKT
jgi:hypothetical protein